MKARLLRLHVALERRFGPQRWWPARTAYEVAVGAVLTQHTAWTNAARAVGALRDRGLLRADRLAALGEADLAETIRAAGTYRLKARRLQALTRWLLARFGRRFDGMRREPLLPLRREMLGITGLGPETVDAILLYAAGRPVFVADAYARRVLERHRLLRPGTTYEAARAFVEGHLPSDPALFNEFHALLVAAAKHHCRTVARCEGCPLRFDLDRHGGFRALPMPPIGDSRRPGGAVATLDATRRHGAPATGRRSARPRRAARRRAPARPSP